jgi:hypothetical protein
VDKLPDGHLLKGFDASELEELCNEITLVMNRQVNASIEDPSTVYASVSEALETPMVKFGVFDDGTAPTWAKYFGLEGLSDWELYKLLQPISGEVYVPGLSYVPGSGPVRLDNFTQVEHYSTHVWGDIPLSSAELDSLQFYTSTGSHQHGDGYRQINRYLRGLDDNPSPDLLRHIENLDRLLARQTVPHTVQVTRSFSLTGAVERGLFPEHDTLSDLPIGHQVTWDGYTSTRLDNKIFDAWDNPGDTLVVVNLEVPPGTPGMGLIQSHRRLGLLDESELLLGRGLTWEVTSQPRFENGIWYIDAKVAPHSAATSTHLRDAPQFPNLLPDRWDGPYGDKNVVLRAMDEVGVTYDVNLPPTPTNRVDDFNRLLEAAPGNQLKYVIREDGTIAFIPYSTPGQGELAHAGITRGPEENVLGAGTITLTRNPDGTYNVVELTNNTGHYKVPASTLEDVVVPVLKQQGLIVPSDVITPYPGS